MLLVQKHQRRYYDGDSEWGEPLGLVRNFTDAYLWATSQMNMAMKKLIMNSQGLQTNVQLIETQEQFTYYRERSSWSTDLDEAKDRVHFPVFAPASASDDSDEFTIAYYIGIESQYAIGFEVLKWKFVKIDELPVVHIERTPTSVYNLPSRGDKQ